MPTVSVVIPAPQTMLAAVPASAITVAAIIPLYNGAAYIREALESVLAQTDPVDEIIVVDDGSTDEGKGAAIVRDMARYDPIRLIIQSNGGSGSARNRGVAESRSSHIALLDQDDIWYSDHVALLKQPFVSGARPHLGVVYGDVDWMDEAGRMMHHSPLSGRRGLHPKKTIRECLSRDMFILPGASLIAREVFKKVGGFDHRLCGHEDDDLFRRIYSAGYEMRFLPNQAVVKWRIFSGSTSYSPHMARSRMIYFRKLVQEYPDEPKMGRYWVRTAIGPRFAKSVLGELARARELGDKQRIEQAWRDLNEVYCTVLRRRRPILLPLLKPVLPAAAAFFYRRRVLRSLGARIIRLATHG